MAADRARGGERGAVADRVPEAAPRRLRLAKVSGGPGIVLRDAFGTLTVIAFTVDAGRIAAIDVVRNPDKLIGVPDPAGEAPPPRAGEGPPPVSSPGASPSRGAT